MCGCGYSSSVTLDMQNSHTRKVVKFNRHLSFFVSFTLFSLIPHTPLNAESVFISKKLYNDSFIDTYVILLYDRIMMTSWLQIMTGTNLYWVTTFIFCRLFFFFPLSFLAFLPSCYTCILWCLHLLFLHARKGMSI